VNYDTLRSQYVGCSDPIGLQDRRFVDIAAMRRAYGRVAEWESTHGVLRNQVVPVIVWISFWMALNWITGWNFGDAAPTNPPAQTQSETQAQTQPVIVGCR
jgi:hypothetical protein